MRYGNLTIKKSTLIFTIVIGIGGILLFYISTEHSDVSKMNIQFIPVYGDFRCLEMNDNTLDLYFLAQNTTKDDILASVKDNRNLSENIFDSNYISVKSVSLAQSSLSWKNYILYQISFTFDLKDGKDVPQNMILSAVRVGGEKYDIGKINLQYSDISLDSGPLKVVSQAVMCPTFDLVDFPISLKNTGESNVIVTDVIAKSFPSSGVLWDIGDQELQTDRLPYFFPKEEEHSLDITLSSSRQEGYQIYYVSPVIKYVDTETNCSYCEYPISFLTGIPQSKEDISTIVANLF